MEQLKAIVFGDCDFTQKMALSGSKSWRAFVRVSMTCERAAKLDWKQKMAASHEWQFDSLRDVFAAQMDGSHFEMRDREDWQHQS
jgi:hypothetical protein